MPLDQTVLDIVRSHPGDDRCPNSVGPSPERMRRPVQHRQRGLRSLLGKRILGPSLWAAHRAVLPHRARGSRSLTDRARSTSWPRGAEGDWPSPRHAHDPATTGAIGRRVEAIANRGAGAAISRRAASPRRLGRRGQPPRTRRRKRPARRTDARITSATVLDRGSRTCAGRRRGTRGPSAFLGRGSASRSRSSDAAAPQVGDQR